MNEISHFARKNSERFDDWIRETLFSHGIEIPKRYSLEHLLILDTYNVTLEDETIFQKDRYIRKKILKIDGKPVGEYIFNHHP